MRTRIFTLLILFPILSFAQDWAPIGAKWTYDHDSGLSPYLTTIESVKDTLVLKKLCRLLVRKKTDENMRPDGSYYWNTMSISKDIIYTSHDTVYHYDRFDKSFYPLYVLNVQKNDQVLVREKVVPCTKNEYFCSRFEYVVDSISSMSLQGRSLKLIYNSLTQTSDWGFNRSWNLENYPILEKIGSLKYFFGVSRNIVMEGGIKCLRCYNDSQISYKAGYWSKECDYLRPLNGLSSVLDNLDNKIVVSPNPFDSYFMINIGNPIEYELYDSFGKRLMQGEEKEVNTTSLPNGIYLLRLTIESKEVKTIKLVKR